MSTYGSVEIAAVCGVATFFNPTLQYSIAHLSGSGLHHHHAGTYIDLLCTRKVCT